MLKRPTVQASTQVVERRRQRQSELVGQMLLVRLEGGEPGRNSGATAKRNRMIKGM
jgi:hypothetical protein